MDRKILWKSRAFDEIELVYDRAEQDSSIGMLLEQLEIQALSEAKENIGMLQGKNGKVLAPEQFDHISENDKETIIMVLGNSGIEKLQPDLASAKIIITLSNLITKFQACAIFSILNRIEKLDGAVNIISPKWTLELQVPLGGKKGLFQWEMLIVKLYPWLSVTETSTDTVAIPKELPINTTIPPKKKSQNPFFNKMSAISSFNEVYGLAKSELETAIKNQPPFMQEWKDNLSLSKWNGLDENERFKKVLSIGTYSIVLSNTICVDFSADLPNCISIALLYLAENKGMKKQIIDAGDRPDPAKRKLVDALTKLHECCEAWDCTIVNPFFEKIGFAEKASEADEQKPSAKKLEKESFWKKLFRKTSNNTTVNASAEVPPKAEQLVSDEVEEKSVPAEEKSVPAEEKKTASSLEKYRKNIYREEELAGMEFPEKLVKYLPSPDKIIITSYGDDTFKGWKRVGVNHIDKGAYISWCNNNDDCDQTFAEAYHPFIQQFTDNTYDCAKKVSRCFSRKPSRCAVTENSLLVGLDMGYVNNGYYESAEVMGYSEHQHESYHDGGGSSSEGWGIYPASVTAQELESSEKYERIKIADLPGDIYCCKGIWKAGEHIYLADPLDIPGIFEYYYYSTYQSDYDSDEEVKNCGVPYSESERFKKKAEEEKKKESKQIGTDLLSLPAVADENSEPITEPTAKEIDVRTLEDLIQGLLPFAQKHGGNNESAAQLANYISKKFHAINSPGKWYFDEAHAEYRHQWCACSPISDSYDEGFIHWKITQIDKVGEGEIINNELLNSSKTYNDEENFICSNPFGLNGLYRIEFLDER